MPNLRLLTTALAPLLLATAPLAAQETDTWNWDGTLADGRRLTVHNLNGGVTVEVGRGDRVEVRAEKRWRRGDPSMVRLEARALGSGNIVVCAMWREGNRCEEEGVRGGRDDSWNNRNDVSVHFTITVPAYAHVTARTVNGGIEIAELRGEVDARTVNGGIEAASSGGPVEAHTVNGDIRVSGRVGREDVEYETVNGSIEIALPADAAVDLSLRTTNGRIQTDFPLTFTGDINPRRIDAQLGGGGPELRARTVNGGIRLRKQ